MPKACNSAANIEPVDQEVFQTNQASMLKTVGTCKQTEVKNQKIEISRKNQSTICNE